VKSLLPVLPTFVRKAARKIYTRLGPERPEALMYRVHLFEELQGLAGPGQLEGSRILEIGPRDGLDSVRLGSLEPAELVMMDLPEKQERVRSWLDQIQCPHQFIEANLMYMPQSEFAALGTFDVIWCTGVLYHNAEQLRLLRKLYKLLNKNGYLVLESSTARGPRNIRGGAFVEIHYPQTFRDTGTVTHHPSKAAIWAWLQMVGFGPIHDSDCFTRENWDLIDSRMACIARKSSEDGADVYYGKSGLNPDYRFGDSS